MARKKKQEAAGFDEQTAAAPGRARLTPVEVQQKVFRLSFRGYNERDVDEFLDRITEELAALHEENKRLREQGGGGGGADLESARSQAEAIVREAREHAARLVGDAESSTGTAAPGLTASFLMRERDFLQGLAQSVQDHARWMKEEARRQRSSGAATAVPVTPPSGAPEGAQGKPAAAAKAPKGKKQRSAEAAPKADASETTAAWSPPPSDSSGVPAESRPGGEPDPLLAAWESAFTGEEPEAAISEQVKPAGAEGEPSLRELFWGEE